MVIFIDVTNIIKVDFITGIQRVVREIITRLQNIKDYEYQFVSWNDKTKQYNFVKGEELQSLFAGDVKNIKIEEDLFWEYNEFCNFDALFFDIDSVWNEKIKRSYLYPVLKANNYKIMTLVYDVIPVLYPEYCHDDTIFRFLDYLTATLKYSDVIVTNTDNTKKDLLKLFELTGAKAKQIEVVHLGADFYKKHNLSDDDIREDAKVAVKAGKYILIVGTIEPRKNHKYLLDCFDEYLKDENVNIVIAGREGWNVADFMTRLKGHSEFNKRIFFIEKANDVTIDYLYNHAFVFAFPSVYEGYGLPIIEALDRGVVTIVSDIEVFKEVAREYCDYFSLDTTKSLNELISRYINNPEMYKNKKNNLAKYNKPTWDETVRIIEDILKILKCKTLTLSDELKQVYILSARKEGLENVLNHIDVRMSFIENIIIECPAKLKATIAGNYRGRLDVKYVTDEELLNGNVLPEDHQERNFYLRGLAIKSGKLDKQFIMYDDDYYPLVDIQKEDFIIDNKYKAYCFYNIGDWTGDISNPSSFDMGAYKTKQWLEKNGLPQKQFSSHMPQIINTKIFMQMLNENPDLKGVDEWSSYFNYAISKYPGNFKIENYKTLCWPGMPSDWDRECIPDEYLFENRYNSFYDKNGIFSELKNNTVTENTRDLLSRISIRTNLQNKHEENIHMQKAVNAVLEKCFGICQFAYCDFYSDEKKVIMPAYVVSYKDCWVKIPFNVVNQKKMEREDWDYTYRFRFEKDNEEVVLVSDSFNITYGLKRNEISILVPKIAGEYRLIVLFESKKLNMCIRTISKAVILDSM